MPTSLLKEMIPLPALQFKPIHDLIDVSLIIPARRSAHSLELAVQEADAFLKSRFPDSYEIVLVPNPSPNDPSDLSIQIAHALSTKFPTVRVHVHTLPPGKGAAIRTGFSFARGKWIFLTDADLPYDLSFFDAATLKLKEGYDLVTGNRRLPSSHFSVPMELLPIAYGRHRLGKIFNRFVRLLLPITTTDTQAGIKALSRRLALEAFERQSCPGFLYDLEIFLTARGQGYLQVGIPVTLFLNSEKSTVRILKESLLVAHWLTRIHWKNKRGAYGEKAQRTPRSVIGRYPSAPWSTRFFLLARWYLTPYSRMTAHLPQQGNILDLGCGHGLFALAAVLQSPDRKVYGLDHDVERIRLGSEAFSDLPQIQLKQGGFDKAHAVSTTVPYSGIAMIDVMHYFNPKMQEQILKQAFDSLGSGGVLLVREVEPNSGMISSWNRLYERLATRIGFTQAEEKDLHFRSKSAWCEIIEKIGFTVTWKHCSSVVFADILFICEKP
jgi:dolichyl-phosphate beta-glucosyltransferase